MLPCRSLAAAFLVVCLLAAPAHAAGKGGAHETKRGGEPHDSKSGGEPPADKLQIVLDGMNDEQAGFISALRDARREYNAARNQGDRDAIIDTLSAYVCDDDVGAQVTEWIGWVDIAGTDKEGKGWLSVLLPWDIRLTTAPPDSDDDYAGGFIPADSELAARVATMKRGELVRFSGHFVDDEESCAAMAPAIFPNRPLRKPIFEFEFDDATAMTLEP